MGDILFVGDVQGCAVELHDLLRVAGFDRHRHRLALCGDLVNRGPDSAAVLQLARGLDALTVIGNHEVALLEGRRTATLDEVRKLLGSALDSWLAWIGPQAVEDLHGFTWIMSNFQHPGDREKGLPDNVKARLVP